MFSDKEFKKYFDKTDFYRTFKSFAVISFIGVLILYFAVLSNMFIEKIIIINPDFINASPQVTYNWVESALLPVIPYFKILIVLCFLTVLFFIFGTYQQIQLLIFRRYVKKIKISVIE